jgi:hypothetical protein
MINGQQDAYEKHLFLASQNVIHMFALVITIEDVWVVVEGRFASIENMGDKFVLSLEKELVYKRIAAKLEEMCEIQLSSWDDRGAIGERIGLFEENERLPMVICEIFAMFQLVFGCEMQQLCICKR